MNKFKGRTSPRIGEGPGPEAQGRSTWFHKNYFPNLHWIHVNDLEVEIWGPGLLSAHHPEELLLC